MEITIKVVAYIRLTMFNYWVVTLLASCFDIEMTNTSCSCNPVLLVRVVWHAILAFSAIRFPFCRIVLYHTRLN